MAQVDVKFIEPFIEGAIATLKVQCKMEAKPGKLFLKGSQADLPTDIAGIIGITSEGFNGSIYLCFPEKTFLAVMGGMLGEVFESLTEDLEDGAGELTNIIFGYGKRVLNQNGYQLQKALPSVVRGGNLQVRHVSPSPTLVIPFSTESGNFHIEIAIEPIANQKVA